jgi:hypothetical protein
MDKDGLKKLPQKILKKIFFVATFFMPFSYKDIRGVYHIKGAVH